MTPDIFSKINEIHIEITKACNLFCRYCYAEPIKPHKQFELFDLELFRFSISCLLRETLQPHVTIIYHGGEPLLQSSQWYQEACQFAEEEAKAIGKTVEFGVQTNLTILKEKHRKVFKQYEVRVGTSIDGPKDIHNLMRSNYATTVSNVKKLQEDNTFSGAITVISHHNYNKIGEIFENFHQIEIKDFFHNIAYSVGRGIQLPHMNSEQISLTYKQIVRLMVQYNFEVVDTKVLRKVRNFLYPPTKEELLNVLRCDTPFCHAGINMLVIKTNGEFYPCGCAGDSGNMKKFILGNIYDDNIDSSEYYQRIMSFHAKDEKYNKVCVCCPARFICDHGCPAFDINDQETREQICAATKNFYAYLREDSDDLIPAYIDYFAQKERLYGRN